MAESSVLPEGFAAFESGTSPDLSAVTLPEVETGQAPTQTPELQAELEKYRQQATEYEQRFKGLQGTVQREVEQRRALEAQIRQVQEQAFQAQLAQLPEGQRELVQRQYAIQQREAEIARQAAELENASRFITAKALSLEHPGVNVEDLARFNSVEDMQLHAQQALQIQQLQAQLAAYQQGQAQTALGQAQPAQQPLSPTQFLPPNTQMPQYVAQVNAPAPVVNFGPTGTTAMAPKPAAKDMDEALFNLIQDPRARRIT